MGRTTELLPGCGSPSPPPLRWGARAVRESKIDERFPDSLVAAVECLPQSKLSRRRSRDGEAIHLRAGNGSPGRAPPPARSAPPPRGGNESPESFVVAKHPARLTVEVPRGVPPATDQQGIGFVRFRRPERGAVESTERNRGESVVAARARYDTARVQWDATNLCTLDPLGSDDQSRVDD